MPTTTEQAAQRYAAAVIRVLAEDFASELNDPYIEEIVVRVVGRQAQNPEPSFEVIIDNPSFGELAAEAQQSGPSARPPRLLPIEPDQQRQRA